MVINLQAFSREWKFAELPARHQGLCDVTDPHFKPDFNFTQPTVTIEFIHSLLMLLVFLRMSSDMR